MNWIDLWFRNPVAAVKMMRVYRCYQQQGLNMVPAKVWLVKRLEMVEEGE